MVDIAKGTLAPLNVRVLDPVFGVCERMFDGSIHLKLLGVVFGTSAVLR
jgi:hypothetical protein